MQYNEVLDGSAYHNVCFEADPDTVPAASIIKNEVTACCLFHENAFFTVVFTEIIVSRRD